MINRKDIIALDPAVRRCGWAVASGGKIVGCGLWAGELFGVGFAIDVGSPLESVRPEDLPDPRYVPPTVLVEIPYPRPSRTEKAKPVDLIRVAFAGGRYAEQVAERYATYDVQTVFPHEWKGGTPKAIDNARTIAKLFPDELALLHATGLSEAKRHDVVDAIGICLWKLGRRR